MKMTFGVTACVKSQIEVSPSLIKSRADLLWSPQDGGQHLIINKTSQEIFGLPLH